MIVKSATYCNIVKIIYTSCVASFLRPVPQLKLVGGGWIRKTLETVILN